MKEDDPPGTHDLRMVVQQATRHLSQAGIETPRREARLLLAHVLGTDLGGLLLRDRIETALLEQFHALLARRAMHEPLSYLTGRAGFWSMTLEVSPATLIPRADTETLIEALLDLRPDRGDVRTILDLGTGTGCLLLAALKEYPQAWGLGVDLSPDAALLASRNARHVGLSGRCDIICGDWAQAIAGRFDVVFSNPPYIPHMDLQGLMPDVRDHEPHRALDGGDDGLDCYRIVMRALAHLLRPHGLGIVELGIGQDRDVAALGREEGMEVVDIRRDLGGIARALVVRQAGEP
ncbi:peptide chain release factor N(5)-glutamine methyltransferase [Gluconacetobacter entanii]|uniref:Release factor glutamine methyltransferase n=1 Tax=Gluconacetobacter entanii TaxID=108528 RepID=A0ABT3K3S0_9PROT|nr:peptide chain release factor N(5)-glutamine methyltransferase [Gluconacetobacter entanii]MCW4590055.1 peptide chain release factor N(5)-glutamine methyltransferase [Gluconacetobacter entanii]MCW4594670.1 peptide chain release factor N(5)-glutamine methyltransferase [Gluconacetobacter entanii]NPC89359.1 peptide chain release factor N(5)-glutamine methyltransferase [Gluconacetobacter entanii]